MKRHQPQPSRCGPPPPQENLTHIHRRCRRNLGLLVAGWLLLIVVSLPGSWCQQQPPSSRLLLHPPNNQRLLAAHNQPQYNSHQLRLLQQQQQQQQPPVNRGVGPQLRVRSAQVVGQQQQQQAAAATDNFDNVIESTTSSQESLGGDLGADEIEAQSAALLGPEPRCQLPAAWAGRWYQANREPIRVTNTEISDKGVCRDQKGDKYLFEMAETSTRAACVVCLVINERHLNVLQYKESSCQPVVGVGGSSSNSSGTPQRSLNVAGDDQVDHSLLEKACSEITGDAQLESMFRLDTPAIECPIAGQYSFTYDYGSRLCREPASAVSSCIDKKQLNFKFSACPDVAGSESKFELLKCYADWSEGNMYYMIGRLELASNHQDNGRFRCFVYEKSPDGSSIQLAQSTDESCYGLINPNEGPKILHLTAKPRPPHKCSFPAYIRGLSENWPSVDNSLVYWFNQDSSKYSVKETLGGSVIEEAVCLQQFNHSPSPANLPTRINQQQQAHSSTTSSSSNSRRLQTTTPSSYNQVEHQLQQHQPLQRSLAASASDAVYLVQITKGCQTTNYCVRFYKRSDGIVQIDYSNASRVVGQCRNAYFELPQTQIITSTSLDPQRCPLEGAYSIEAPMESYLTYNPSNIFLCPRQSFLTAQCEQPSRLRIHSRCSPAKAFVKNLHCLGSWTSAGLVRLLLADDDRQRYSAWYRATDLGPSQDGATPPTHLAAANPGPASNSLAPIIDLHLALITPAPSAMRTMHVRLTRRNQCSDLQSTSGAGSGSRSAQEDSARSSWHSSLPFYAAPGSGAAPISSSAWPLLLLPIVTLLMSWPLLAPLSLEASGRRRTGRRLCL